MSAKGIDAFAYFLKSAASCAVGCSRYTCPSGVLASYASPNHSAMVKDTYLLAGRCGCSGSDPEPGSGAGWPPPGRGASLHAENSPSPAMTDAVAAGGVVAQETGTSNLDKI